MDYTMKGAEDVIAWFFNRIMTLFCLQYNFEHLQGWHNYESGCIENREQNGISKPMPEKKANVWSILHSQLHGICNK